MTAPSTGICILHVTKQNSLSLLILDFQNNPKFNSFRVCMVAGDLLPAVYIHLYYYTLSSNIYILYESHLPNVVDIDHKYHKPFILHVV